MTSNVPRTIKHALLVEEVDLRSLWEFISKYYETINITAKRTDESTLSDKNIEEIISYENPNYRKIKSISIDAESGYKETLRLDIRSENMFFSYENARLEIKSEDDAKALFLADEIQKKFLEMRPRYFLLAAPLIHIMVVVVIVACLFSVIAVGIKVLISGTDSLNRLSIGNLLFNTNAAFCLTYAVLAPFIVPFIEKIQDYLFPKVFFLLGRQKKTMEEIQKVRGFIFGGIIFTIIISVIANLITNLISK